MKEKHSKEEILQSKRVSKRKWFFCGGAIKISDPLK
jgi:hypothetical protein